MLLLLDLSAAFDTIDNEILLERLSVSGGVFDTALAWYRSYLTGRTQSVRIHSTTSKPRLLSYVVPQGSVLRPLIFILYSEPIARIGLLRRYGLIAHLYVDDTQLCIVLDQGEEEEEYLFNSPQNTQYKWFIKILIVAVMDATWVNDV